MLDEDPVRRPRDAGGALATLEAFEQEMRREGLAPARVRLVSLPRWRIGLAALMVVVVAATVIGVWVARRDARIRWALQALPRITFDRYVGPVR
jgi:hypothetical protein